MENRTRRKTLGDRGVPGGFRVNHHEAATDLSGDREIDVAIAKEFFPHREQLRIEVLHGKEAGLVITGEHGGSGAGQDAGHSFQPIRFVPVSRRGRQPLIRDPQLG